MAWNSFIISVREMEMSKIQVQPTRRETGIKVSSGKLYGCKREWRLTSIRGRLPQERVINPGYEMSINVFSIQVPTFTRLSYATDRVRMGHGRRDIGVRCDVTLRGSSLDVYDTAQRGMPHLIGTTCLRTDISETCEWKHLHETFKRQD